jgi:hypothetical protein
VAKDRAAPFSRKHRRYWIPVTGGMLVIGALNVGIGLCSYTPPGTTQPIYLEIPSSSKPLAPGELGLGDIPAPVMRAFVARYPQTIPASAVRDGDDYVLNLPSGRDRQRARFTADGAFVADE